MQSHADFGNYNLETYISKWKNSDSVLYSAEFLNSVGDDVALEVKDRIDDDDFISMNLSIQSYP